MRRLIVSEFMSLDGVIENPMWTFPYWNDEIASFKNQELFGVGELLLGRVTYEGFAEAWPSRTDEQGYADRINSMPKHVVSTTLERADWSNSVIVQEDIVAAIRRLKEQPGQDILVFGSGELVQTLIAHDLVDHYHLMLYPIVLGKGARLFKEGAESKLRLVESQPYATGVTLLRYDADRAAGEGQGSS